MVPVLCMSDLTGQQIYIQGLGVRVATPHMCSPCVSCNLYTCGIKRTERTSMGTVSQIDKISGCDSICARKKKPPFVIIFFHVPCLQSHLARISRAPRLESAAPNVQVSAAVATDEHWQVRVAGIDARVRGALIVGECGDPHARAVEHIHCAVQTPDDDRRRRPWIPYRTEVGQEPAQKQRGRLRRARMDRAEVKEATEPGTTLGPDRQSMPEM